MNATAWRRLFAGRPMLWVVLGLLGAGCAASRSGSRPEEGTGATHPRTDSDAGRAKRGAPVGGRPTVEVPPTSPEDEPMAPPEPRSEPEPTATEPDDPLPRACRDYLEEARRCAASIPKGEAREALARSLESTERAWRDASELEGTGELLGESCAKALEMLQKTPVCEQAPSRPRGGSPHPPP